MAVFEDFYFFWSHWAFHHPLLYRFHKVHHEYTITVSTAGFHFHLFEAFVTQQINAGIYMKAAMAYAPIHVNTLIYWYIFRTWDAYNGHCGYVFPWSPLQLIPFCTNDDYHDFHHTQNYGNYGSLFRFWDILFGFTKPFREHKRKQREIKK
jgi:sterol desaturase/sphingolipid hydroxylase (fatty acid hydroxylase superfamily)